LDKNLTGVNTIKVRSENGKNGFSEREVAVPSFVKMGKDKVGNDVITGYDHPMIEKAFRTAGAGDAYMNMEERKLLATDPTYKAKYDTFAAANNQAGSDHVFQGRDRARL
jgi:hypothetical protein